MVSRPSSCEIDCLRPGVAITGYKMRTEQRRLKRISDRQGNTVCFACRENGHAARDCPKAGGGNGNNRKNVNTAVGMCYRFVSSFLGRILLHVRQMWFDETYVVSMQENRRSSQSLTFRFVFRLLWKGSSRFSVSPEQREGYIPQRWML